MVELTFAPEMRDALAHIKGKTFKSYEGYFPGGWGTVVVGPMNINLGSFSIEMKCEYCKVDGWEEVFVYDPPACLKCYERKQDELFRTESSPSTIKLVGERVTGVEIVNDRIEIDGASEVSIDVALVIRTKYHVYTFSRGIWFDDAIYVGIGDEIDIRYTKEKCEDTWSYGPDDEVLSVTVARTSQII